MKKNKTSAEKTGKIWSWSIPTLILIIAILALLKKTHIGFFEV